MRSNKEQREGLAKVLDNMASAFIIGATVGAVVDGKISAFSAACIYIFSAMLAFFAFKLRGIKEIENV